MPNTYDEDDWNPKSQPITKIQTNRPRRAKTRRWDTLYVFGALAGTQNAVDSTVQTLRSIASRAEKAYEAGTEPLLYVNARDHRDLLWSSVRALKGAKPEVVESINQQLDAYISVYEAFLSTGAPPPDVDSDRWDYAIAKALTGYQFTGEIERKATMRLGNRVIIDRPESEYDYEYHLKLYNGEVAKRGAKKTKPYMPECTPEELIEMEAMITEMFGDIADYPEDTKPPRLPAKLHLAEINRKIAAGERLPSRQLTDEERWDMDRWLAERGSKR